MIDSNQAGSLPAFLFLDFDGVCHPGLAGTFIHLDKLERLLYDLPHIQVVLSTTWRLEHEFSYLVALFSPELQSRVIGCTPELAGATRDQEILAWLSTHRVSPTAPWVALDDDASLFSNGFRKLVLCDPARGLRAPQLAALREQLAQ